MGKKNKFIDKKKSATFHLLARDTSDPNYVESSSSDIASDRVFVRVDNNPYSFNEEDHNDPDSIFADAPNVDDKDVAFERPSMMQPQPQPQLLPDHVRREILELGFPDDGYNYLTHMREIKNTGGGSAYYDNPRARLDLVPSDVKAYDASRVRILQQQQADDSYDSRMYDVAAKTVNVRPQKAIDPEVAAILDDSDLSQFGSDNDDLEEDFVLKANLLEQGETSAEGSQVINHSATYDYQDSVVHEVRNHLAKEEDHYVDVKAQERQILDDQFDLLLQKEYGSDDDVYDDADDEDDDGDHGYNSNLADEEEESRLEKFKQVFGEPLKKDDIELLDGEYELPSDDILRRVSEYAHKYENESEDEVIIAEESSDESEQWDCDTIVSTYSNLDNHPGRIGAPGSRKKKLAETVSRALSSNTHVISLGGKEKLPVDFLPRSKMVLKEKLETVSETKVLPPKRSVGQESKEEKKERKAVEILKLLVYNPVINVDMQAAVKEERREARKMKKDMKDLYRHEGQRAQRAAAISAPSTIRIM
ncbi:hypothetical protein ACFE04_024706 [Oxalis oulophora]